jgi:thioester reductase-like protein
VNHVLSYSDLKQANVGGTLEIINFACNGKKKRVIYLSTISVFSWAGRTGSITEDMLPNAADVKHAGGYSASKWVAEKLLDQSRVAGLEVSTLRLGMVSWNSTLGVPNRQDWFYRLMLGIWALGSAPKSAQYARINLIPVEIITKIVSSFTFQRDTAVSHLNLVNNALTSLEDVLNALVQVESAQKSSQLPSLTADNWVSPFGNWRSLIDKAISASRSRRDTITEKILSPLLLFRSGLPDDKKENYQLDTLRGLLKDSELLRVLESTLSIDSIRLAWSTVISDFFKLSNQH